MARNPPRRPDASDRRSDGGMYRFGGNDAPRRDFDFRAPNHAAHSFSPAQPRRFQDDRPRFGRRDDHDGGRFRQNRDNRGRSQPNNHRGRGGFQRGGFQRRPAASGREILSVMRSPTPEQLPGMIDGGNSFRVLADEDEDEDSQLVVHNRSPAAASENSEENDHPRAKRAKTGGEEVADSKPKWSNPDPYTALPPPDASHGPKVNILDMIRKAKVEKEGTTDQTAKADDFISFDAEPPKSTVDDDIDEQGDHPRALSPSADGFSIRGAAARGRHMSGRDDRYRDDRWDHESSSRYPARDEPRGRFERTRSRSPPRRGDRYSYSPSPERYDRSRRDYPSNERDGYMPYDTYSTYQRDREYGEPYRPEGRSGFTAINASYPVPPAHARYPEANRSLDVWPPPAPLPAPYAPPTHASEYRKRRRGEGVDLDTDTPIVPGWLPLGGEMDTPWMSGCTSPIAPERWLHAELDAFYCWVSPKQSERHMRTELIERMKLKFANNKFGEAIKAFGSSATHLYLPTGDVDLVMLSAQYQRSGQPAIKTNANTLRRFLDPLVRTGACREAQYIAKAKVPLVKFVDTKTGLPVDISFENDSGLHALDTLYGWMDAYPALKRLVFPLKQLLKMHGVNEVNMGGLGGFSTICLIAFRLHHLGLKHGKDWAVEHLDLALIDVFDYFHSFDLEFKGLDMANMGIVNKATWVGYKRSKPDRLLLIDPNNPLNDMSGGSHKIKSVFAMFGKAAETLRREMRMVQSVPATQSPRRSMLRGILGANYYQYELRRQHLERLYQQDTSDKPEPAVVDLTADPQVVDLTGSEDEYQPPGPVAVTQPVAPRSKDKVSAEPAQAPSAQASTAGSSKKRKHTENEQTISEATASEGPRIRKKKPKKRENPTSTQRAALKEKRAAEGLPPNPPGPKPNKTKEQKQEQRKEKVAERRRYLEENKEPIAEQQRALDFQRRFPGVDCPPRLTREHFNQLLKQQG